MPTRDLRGDPRLHRRRPDRRRREVGVTGLVTEFRPGGSGQPNLTTTELTSPTIDVLSTGNPLPRPQIVGVGGRVRRGW